MQTNRRRWRLLAAAALIVGAVTAVVAPGAQAETKPCTLIGFEEAVFSTGGEFTFACASDTTLMIGASYAFNNVPANGSITLDGGNRLTLKAGRPNWLFMLDNSETNRTLTLKNMTIEGFVQSSQDGSVVRISSTNRLIVDNVIFRNNAATNGRKGGVIFSSAPVTVTNSVFFNNRSEGGPHAGGGAIVVDAQARSLTVSGSTFISNTAPVGGAISTTITTTISSSSFISNVARPTAVLIGESVTAHGGAISLGDEYRGPFVVSLSLFQENRAEAVGGAGTAIIGGGDGTARGGAIFVGLNATGAMTVTSSVFSSNRALGFGGIGTPAAGNGKAEGGAIALREFGFPLTNLSSSFISNVADGKGANRQPAGNGGGNGDAAGGALFSYAQQTRITNSTFALNDAYGHSDSGNPTIGAGTAHGGAIHLGGAATAAIRFSTIVSNTVRFNQAGAGGLATGGGIEATSAVLTGTIVAKNSNATTSTPSNCSPTANFTSGGYNLSDVVGCNFTGSGDAQNATSPNLGPPANNGGPTVGSAAQPAVLLTLLPGAGSPAIDTGGTSATGCPSTDQRGASRPAGPQCDKGAVEAGSPPPATPTPTPPPLQQRVRIPITSLNQSAD